MVFLSVSRICFSDSTVLVGLDIFTVEASRSHTFKHTTLGRTPLDQWSARRNTHKRQTSMPPAEFESAIAASERPHTHALDRSLTGIGFSRYSLCKLQYFYPHNNHNNHTILRSVFSVIKRVNSSDMWQHKKSSGRVPEFQMNLLPLRHARIYSDYILDCDIAQSSRRIQTILMHLLPPSSRSCLFSLCSSGV